ncbi:MAG: DinB family protein [Pyrinomonadaceae bacterium]
MVKPGPQEYDAYYERYISLVTNTDVVADLARQPAELREGFGKFGDEQGTFAYSEGKWSVKEVLGHIIDGERMFAYRAFRISRGDTTPIEGFEQDGYIENARANERTMDDLLDEFELLRLANVIFFKNLIDADWRRKGTASGLGISVAALAYIMAGHVTHHVNILAERYTV